MMNHAIDLPASLIASILLAPALSPGLAAQDCPTRRASAPDSALPAVQAVALDGLLRLQNGDSVRAVISCLYPSESPPIRRSLGLLYYVAEDGRVAAARVETASGHPEVDEAVRQGLLHARFTPPFSGGQPTGAWIRKWFDLPLPPGDALPRLINQSEVGKLIQDYYPEDLEDERIGGRVELWLFIDEDGSVAKAEVKSSSGHAGLDQAALQVGVRFRFEPAQHYWGARVAVWVSQWITFEVLARRW